MVTDKVTVNQIILLLSLTHTHTLLHLLFTLTLGVSPSGAGVLCLILGPSRPGADVCNGTWNHQPHSLTTSLTVWPPTSQVDQPHSLTTNLTVWPPTSQFDHQPHSLTTNLTVYLTNWFQTVVFGFSDGQFKTQQGRNTMNSQQDKTYLCRKTMNPQGRKPWTHNRNTTRQENHEHIRPKQQETGQNKDRPKMAKDRPKQHRTSQNDNGWAKTEG